MSRHSSFADDMPDLYPPETARNRDDHIDVVRAAVNKLLAANPGLTIEQKHDLLVKADFQVEDVRDGECSVYVGSHIAPELDYWIPVLPDPPPPQPRTIDDDWVS